MRIRLAALLSSLTLWIAYAQIAPVSFAVIAGDGTVHQISTNAVLARTILFRAPAGNSAATCTGNTLTGCVWIGDSTISTSRGTFMYPGDTKFVPESAGSVRHDLSKWYYLVQSGDKLTLETTQ